MHFIVGFSCKPTCPLPHVCLHAAATHVNHRKENAATKPASTETDTDVLYHKTGSKSKRN